MRRETHAQRNMRAGPNKLWDNTMELGPPLKTEERPPVAAAATPAVGAPPLAHWLDRHVARPMFFFSLVYLAVASGVIHRIGHGHFELFELQLIAWCLVAFWPAFALEAVLRFWLSRHQLTFWQRFWILLGVLVAPPIRLGLRSIADARQVWLPGLGCRVADRALRKRMERFFSLPMILIALLVLPVLLFQFLWEEEVRAHFWWAFALDLASSVIWMAFAIEFILMVSLTDKKVAYCFQNWMDMAVVLLPVVDALPILRLWQLTRVFQLNQLSRLGRVYRLRGLLMKAWRAFLLLEMISRLLGDYKERRRRKLRDLIAAREIELEELRQELAEIDRELEAEERKKQAVTAAAPPSQVTPVERSTQVEAGALPRLSQPTSVDCPETTGPQSGGR